MTYFQTLFIAATLALSGTSHAATVFYTLTGGPLTGTFAGAPFSASSFTITATADTVDIVSGNFSILGYDGRINIVTPTITIDSSIGFLTATLTIPNAGTRLVAAELDTSPGNNSAYGFAYFTDFNSDFPGVGISASTTSPNGLDTPDVFSGDLLEQSIIMSSDRGDILLDIPTGSPGTFTISAVPEPAAATSSLALTLAGFSLVSRRRRI